MQFQFSVQKSINRAHYNRLKNKNKGAYTCNPGTQKAEVGESSIQPVLHSVILSQKTKIK
jgi:hypothetical protein